MLDGYPLVSTFSIPFADVDMMQHVNNVAYIRWCETMRGEYFARVMQAPINGERGMIQANIHFTYERELSYRERITVGIRVPRIGTKSSDFEYAIVSDTYGHRAAHGTTAVVAFDFMTHKTIAIPPQWREAIAAFEAGPQQEFH